MAAVPSAHPVARLGAALDRGGDQAVDVQPVADELEHLQLGLGRPAVGGRDLARPARRRSRARPAGRARGDPVERELEPVLLLEQLGAGRADLDDPLGVEVR